MGKTKIKTVEMSTPEPEKKVESDQQKKTKISKISKKKATAKIKVRGKQYQEALSKVDRTQKYSLKEAVDLASQSSYSKFPGTLEIHLNTAVKNLRGLVTLPHFAGKKLTILAFGPADLKTSDIPELEGVLWGDEATVIEIEKGKINFDVLVTTPAWMPKLAKMAKILGPKGLMPNPKNGTITDNLEKTIKELKAGKTEYKTESNGQIIHLPIGKINQPTEEIMLNIKTLINTVGKSKIKKVTLSATMGPGVKVDLSSI